MPLMRADMYAKGVEICCAPTLDGRDSWLASMRHLAVEGHCFVLSCSQFARRGGYPTDYAGFFGDDPTTVISRGGGACIVDPFGEFLVEPNFEGEAVLLADIDRGAIVRGKYDFDATGHCARPDVFRLTVDKRRRTSAVTLNDEEAGQAARSLDEVAE